LKCGFFKRFEPQELAKFTESQANDIEGANDVVDISKHLIANQNGYEKASIKPSLSTPAHISKFGYSIPRKSPPNYSNQRTTKHSSNPNTDLTTNLTALYSEISRNKANVNEPHESLLHQRSSTANSDPNQSTNVNSHANPMNSIKFTTFASSNPNVTGSSDILSNKFETFIAYSKANSNNYDNKQDTKPVNTFKKDENNLAKLPPVPKRTPNMKSGLNRSNTLKYPSSNTRPNYMNQIDFHPTQNNVILENLNFTKFSTEKNDRQYQIADNMRYGTLKSNAIVCQEFNKPILKSLNTNYEQNL
jgi:hypothetical protein